MEFGPSWKQNQVNQEKYPKWPNVTPDSRLFVNDFALIHYSRLKLVDKVDIIV